MDMIERVARAIEARFEREGRVFDEGQAAELARAAIEAMLEPTEEMMEALRFYGMLDGDPEEAWEMTIGRALDPASPLRGH